MLIIFDLDDTLIDTSGSITPIKLADALECMIQKGLPIIDPDVALDLLKRLDAASESTRHTLAEFLEIMGAESRFLEIGIQEVYENFSSDISVTCVKDAKEVLGELREEHLLALVTAGRPEQQVAKMKKAGIDSALFSKIIVCREGEKKASYKSVVEELNCSSEEVIVCGDKIQNDLSPAKEWGYKTVHMRWGRGLNSIGPKKDVDYVITELRALKEITNTTRKGITFYDN